uniref:Putative secreted protein n=1 Tax=Ixodes ricinus TaxID=34613 RepID=A0A6B0TV81_IXORI
MGLALSRALLAFSAAPSSAASSVSPLAYLSADLMQKRRLWLRCCERPSSASSRLYGDSPNPVTCSRRLVRDTALPRSV